VATLAVAGYGLGTAVWHLMLASAVFNALETAGTIVWITAKQRHVPSRMLGRVSSLDWLISIGLLPLSFATHRPGQRRHGRAGRRSWWPASPARRSPPPRSWCRVRDRTAAAPAAQARSPDRVRLSSEPMELWVCPPRPGRVPRGGRAAGAPARARDRGELPEPDAAARAPAGLHRGAPHGRRRPAVREAFYSERGIDVVRTPRGGQLTYHGPGQLVGYPIMHVASVPEYILTMERAIVAALGRAGIEAETKLGHKHVGVWVGERKIASSACTSRHGVSSHGFAVNVDNDLDAVHWVVACGLPDVQMTSMAPRARGGLACFRKRMGARFARRSACASG
jgi:lipoate-protein ligase B